jgi:hypothetical protein
MHEGALLAVGLRDQRRIRDDPFLGVGRDVGTRLVNLAEVQSEGRREETRLLLDGRQIARFGDLTAHRASELLAVGVDEARLADARRVEPLEIVELVRHVREVAAVAHDLLLARPGLRQDPRERRRVARQQHDRPRSREVALERAAMLIRLRDQRPLDL